MSLTKYSPKTSLTAKRGWAEPDFFRSWANDNLFSGFWDSLYSDLHSLNLESYDNVYNVHTKETESNYLIRLETPGYTKEEIQVEVNDGILVIKGEKKQKDETWDVKSNFLRQFSLPKDSSLDTTDAKIEDGILLITIPKIKKETKQIKIT